MDEIISEVRRLWPHCIMVKGRPRHSQSNGGIERANRSLEEGLFAWMMQNKSSAWSVGRNFVRWEMNSRKSAATGARPYELLTGQVHT